MSLLVSHDMHSPKPITKQKKVYCTFDMQEIRFSATVCTFESIVIEKLSKFYILYRFSFAIQIYISNPIHAHVQISE